MKRRAATALLCLALAAGCGPRRYRLISHDENYSQDPSLLIEVTRVAEVTPGKTAVEFSIENRRSEALPLGELKTVLLDPRSKEVPLLSRPEGEIGPGESRTVSLLFDTGETPRGEYSMRLVLPVAPSQVGPNHHETRIWPIVFATP